MTNAEMYQGQLEQAIEGKKTAWKRVKDVRAKIKNEPLGGDINGLELELIRAKERHAEYLAMEREAKERLKEV